jgi:hypothetical protein
MCWEREKEYDDDCFDFLWNDYELFDGNSIVSLLKGWNVKFETHEIEQKAKLDFFKLLSHWHDQGIIKPSKNERQL